MAKLSMEKAVAFEGGGEAPSAHKLVEVAAPLVPSSEPCICSENDRASGGMTRWRVNGGPVEKVRYCFAKSQADAERVYRESTGSTTEKLTCLRMVD